MNKWSFISQQLQKGVPVLLLLPMAANYSCILSSSSEEEEEDGDIYRHSSFHPFDSYSISADVSESESCSSASTFSSRPPPPPPPQAAASHALNSLSSSSDSPARPKVMFPVVGHRHVVIPEEKQDEPELSGESFFSNLKQIRLFTILLNKLPS